MARRALSPLARARRQAARLALYLSLTVTLAVAWLLLDRGLVWLGRAPQVRTESARWAGVDFLSMPEVQLLQRYVSIDTTEPDGSEVVAARFLAAEFARRGIASQIEEMGDERANFWAILEGERREAIVLHHHIDVQPRVESELWVHPPFSGAVDGPWMYGRGVLDMKSIAVAQMLALFDLAASGRKPKYSVIFLGTSGEETGSDLGAAWFVRQHPELLARFAAVLTEGGVVEATSPSDIKYWGIEFAQRPVAELTFCHHDRQRLEALAADLRELAPLEAERLTPEVASFLRDYGPSREEPHLRRLLARPERLLEDPPSFAELSPFVQSLLRSELSLFPIQPAAGGGFELPVKILQLPGESLPTAVARLVPFELAAGVSWSWGRGPAAQTASPTEHPVYSSLLAAVRDRYPSARAGSYVSPWSISDARYFRSAGIPSYGFPAFPVVVTDTYTIGRPDEKMALSAYLEGVELYQAALARLAN